MANSSYEWPKRFSDVAVAAAGLVVFSPVMAVVAMVVRLTLGRPVFFRQVRPGLHNRPFTIVKYRTMRVAEADEGASDAERLTPFGAFLRSTSLDELPELVNVLRGDMSLVGPRPLRMEYLDRYSPTQARRHEVRPGMTGWAQVNGRNAMTWDEKFELDVWYVDHRSLLLDLRILIRTVAHVLRRDGITQPGSVTAEDFVEGDT